MRKLFISFISLLVLVWSGDASASYTPTKKQYRYASSLGWSGDAGSACSSFAAFRTSSDQGTNWTVASAPSPPQYLCKITGDYSNGHGHAGDSSVDPLTRVVCNDGSLPNAQNLCTDDEQQKKCDVAAGSSVSWNQLTGHAASASALVPDAATRYSSPDSSPKCGIDGVSHVQKCWSVAGATGGIDFYCSFTATSDGSDSPSSAPVASGTGVPSDAKPTNADINADSKGRCPVGTLQAGVDSSGIPICIGSGTNPENASNTSTTAKPPTTTTGTDGTKTTTAVTTTTNSDGSVTTTTTTTVVSPDGTVKTSQSSSTGAKPDGTGGKSDDSKDFCSAHPELTVCQNSSVSGSCGQTACQGDAIQCATLRAAAAMQCAQQQDTDALKAMPQKALGDQIMAGADPMAGQISDTLKGTEVDMSRVSFDQSGFLSGGTCLANRSFVVMGRVVPVDFTTVCNNIAPLRAVMMAVALIMAYLIVGRSVVGS